MPGHPELKGQRDRLPADSGEPATARRGLQSADSGAGTVCRLPAWCHGLSWAGPRALVSSAPGAAAYSPLEAVFVGPSAGTCLLSPAPTTHLLAFWSCLSWPFPETEPHSALSS